MLALTATLAPRVGADWSEELALSGVGRPATTPGVPGQRRVIGKVVSCAVSERGELVIGLEVEEGEPTGSVLVEVSHNLAEGTERILSVAIDPDVPIGSLSWEKM